MPSEGSEVWLQLSDRHCSLHTWNSLACSGQLPPLLFPLGQLWQFPECSFLSSLKTAAHPILFLMSAVNLQNMLCFIY